MTTVNKVTLAFSCGARIVAVEEPQFNRLDARGRGRLVVYDTQGGETRPARSDGALAPCLLACPCKRDAGRRQIRALGDDGSPFPMRFVVTCYARIEKGTP